jgi:hypothetical protein
MANETADGQGEVLPCRELIQERIFTTSQGEAIK